MKLKTPESIKENQRRRLDKHLKRLEKILGQRRPDHPQLLRLKAQLEALDVDDGGGGGDKGRLHVYGLREILP
jgi:hypothetical protein